MISTASSPSISSKDFIKLYTEGSQQLVVLDVRTPEELQIRHLPDTKSTKVTSINTDDFFNNKAEVSIKQVKDLGSQTIYCLCRSGNRSGRVTQLLLDNDIKTVNIEGGISAIQI